MPDLVALIKKAAIEAVVASNPMGILFGQVMSIAPLKINVEQKLTLTDKQLILTKNVRDYEAEMTVNHFTNEDSYLNTTHSHPDAGANSFDSTHKHEYSGRKKFTVHNGLKAGDEVILLRMQGGQKYVVLDKWVKT